MLKFDLEEARFLLDFGLGLATFLLGVFGYAPS